MSGKYFSLQSRIIEVSKYAIPIACTTHSLNLVDIQAVECVTEAEALIQFVQLFLSCDHTMEKFCLSI